METSGVVSAQPDVYAITCLVYMCLDVEGICGQVLTCHVTHTKMNTDFRCTVLHVVLHDRNL